MIYTDIVYKLILLKNFLLNMSDLFSKANSIKCHIKHHSDLGLGISVMCLDEKCISNKKAICAICAKESHTNHKVISISKID